MIGHDTDDKGIIGQMSLDQEKSFRVSDMDPSLDYTKRNWRKRIREDYKKRWLPALEHLLSELEPTKRYISYLKYIEETYCTTPTQKAAYKSIQYGSLGIERIERTEDEIAREKNNICSMCITKKSELQLFQKLTGLRGVFSGYSLAGRNYKEEQDRIPSPVELAEWYIKYINRAYEDNQFSMKNTLLRHIAFDHNDNIVNYKFEHQDSALGAYCALLASIYAYQDSKQEQWEGAVAEYLAEIRATLLKG